MNKVDGPRGSVWWKSKGAVPNRTKVKRRKAWEPVGELVNGSEATVKKFYREAGGWIRLQPANSEMQPIVVAASQVKIQGRVVGVLRKY